MTELIQQKDPINYIYKNNTSSILFKNPNLGVLAKTVPILSTSKLIISVTINL